MIKYLLSLLVTVLFTGVVTAQDSTIIKQIMQITAIESIYNDGLGASKLIVTHADGKQEEEMLESATSLTSISIVNIKYNDLNIMRAIKKYTDQGWKVEQVVSYTFNPAKDKDGIFMTRYLLSKPEKKQLFSN